MRQEKVFAIRFSSLYPMYVKKVESKRRTQAELDQVIRWLTGYGQEGLEAQLASGHDLETFFAQAPAFHPNAALIKGGGRETSNPTSDNGCCGSDVRLR